jgi:hypothetical protein
LSGVAALAFVDAARVLFFGVTATLSAAEGSETVASTFFFLGALAEAAAGLLVLRAFFVAATVSSLDVATFFVALGFAAVVTCRVHCRNMLGALPRVMAVLRRHLERRPSIWVFRPMIDIFDDNREQMARLNVVYHSRSRGFRRGGSRCKGEWQDGGVKAEFSPSSTWGLEKPWEGKMLLEKKTPGDAT